MEAAPVLGSLSEIGLVRDPVPLDLRVEPREKFQGGRIGLCYQHRSRVAGDDSELARKGGPFVVV
jgi:hypothetical protein